MAVVALADILAGNNNAANTDVFRTYVKDNFEAIRQQCTKLTVNGRTMGRYKNNSHAMWIELGLDQKYCLIADFLNGINGNTDLSSYSTIYLPEGTTLDAMARKVNR